MPLSDFDKNLLERYISGYNPDISSRINVCNSIQAAIDEIKRLDNFMTKIDKDNVDLKHKIIELESKISELESDDSVWD